jgi:hypothetical protein
MDLLQSALISLVLSLGILWVLSRTVFNRLPQGVVLVSGAIAVGAVVLLVFYGPVGIVTGLLCAGSVVAGGALLYSMLWLMERWAKGGGD